MEIRKKRKFGDAGAGASVLIVFRSSIIVHVTNV